MEASQLRSGCLACCLLVIAFAESAFGGSLVVAWNHSTDSRTAGYLVSYGTAPGKYTGSVKTGYVTSVSVGSLTDGTVYYFMVQSYDKDNVAGAPSSEVSARVPTSAGPAITCPSPILTSLDGQPLAVTLTPTVTGGVTPVSTACTPPSGSLFPVGTTSFTCTATDAAQQKSACTSQVVVTASWSTPPPSTTLPPNQTPAITLTCPTIEPVTATPNALTAIVRYDPPTFSGGTAPVNVTCSPLSGSRFTIGTTTVACRATDARAETAMCTTTAVVNPRR